MSMKRFLMFLVIAGLLAFGLAVPYVLAGGGPGPGGAGPDGCYAYYSSWSVQGAGSATQIYPGDSISFNVLANCPVAVSNTWNSEKVAVTQYDVDHGEYGMSNVPVTFTTTSDRAPGDNYINAVFDVAPDQTDRYVHVLIGDLPAYPIALSLGSAGSKWVSYADYTERNLSVGYQVANVGSYDAYHTILTTATASNGVTPMMCPGDSSGDCFWKYVAYSLAPGAISDVLWVKYHVPPGVASFRAIVYAQTMDFHDKMHYFPPGSPPPAP